MKRQTSLGKTRILIANTYHDECCQLSSEHWLAHSERTWDYCGAYVLAGTMQVTQEISMGFLGQLIRRDLAGEV